MITGIDRGSRSMIRTLRFDFSSVRSFFFFLSSRFSIDRRCARGDSVNERRMRICKCEIILYDLRCVIKLLSFFVLTSLRAIWYVSLSLSRLQYFVDLAIPLVSLSFSYMPLIPPFLLSVTLCLIVLSGCIYYSFFVPRYVLPTVRSRIFFVSTRHIYQGYCLFLPFLFLIFLFLPSPLIEWPFWDTSVRRLRLFHCARTLARVFCIKQQDHTQRIYIHKNSRSTSVYL